MSTSSVFRRLGAAFASSAAAAIVVAATFAAMLGLMFSAQEEVMRRDREVQMRAVGQMLGSAFDEAARFALSHAEAMGQRAAVKKAMAEKDRDGLLALSKPTWDYLAAQAGVQIFGYHSTDLKYFLRVHRPDGPIDDISRGRPMVLAGNRSGRAQSGLEIGITGLVGARGISVIRDGDTLIGTMEVGLDLDPILERVKTVTNAEIAVILGQSLTGLPAQGRAPGAGPAVGDLIVAAESAYFLQAFRRIGLVPDGGSTYLLTRAIGRARAMEMALLGEKIPAAKALEWGLVNRVVEDADLKTTAIALAKELAAGPASLGAIRKLIWEGLDNDWNGQLTAERKAQKVAGKTEDFIEGVSAFLQKRVAAFKGR